MNNSLQYSQRQAASAQAACAQQGALKAQTDEWQRKCEAAEAAVQASLESAEVLRQERDVANGQLLLLQSQMSELRWQGDRSNYTILEQAQRLANFETAQGVAAANEEALLDKCYLYHGTILDLRGQLEESLKEVINLTVVCLLLSFSLSFSVLSAPSPLFALN